MGPRWIRLDAVQVWSAVTIEIACFEAPVVTGFLQRCTRMEKPRSEILSAGEDMDLSRGGTLLFDYYQVWSSISIPVPHGERPKVGVSSFERRCDMQQPGLQIGTTRQYMQLGLVIGCPVHLNSN